MEDLDPAVESMASHAPDSVPPVGEDMGARFPVDEVVDSRVEVEVA